MQKNVETIYPIRNRIQDMQQFKKLFHCFNWLVDFVKRWIIGALGNSI